MKTCGECEHFTLARLNCPDILTALRYAQKMHGALTEIFIYTEGNGKLGIICSKALELPR